MAESESMDPALHLNVAWDDLNEAILRLLCSQPDRLTERAAAVDAARKEMWAAVRVVTRAALNDPTPSDKPPAEP